MKNKIYYSFLLLIFTVSLHASEISKPVSSRYGYIENKGQVIDQDNHLNPVVKYLFNSSGLNVQLRANGFSYDTYMIEKKPSTKPTSESPMPDKFKMPDEDVIYHFHRVDIEFINANKNPQFISEQTSSDYTNYYTTGTPEEGVLNVKTFQKIMYKNLYEGIDLQFLVNETKPKYNFIIHPGADVSQIRWKYNGAFSASLSNGKIILELAQGNLEEKIPESFIEETSEKVHVSYISFGESEFGFSASSFNKNATLVIDPLPWATYFGGSGQEVGSAITTDSIGNVYITGQTFSATSIATSGTYQTTFGGNSDAFIAKFNLSGSLQWATYCGGSGDDGGSGIAIDFSGNVLITGSTSSITAIADSGAYQTSLGGGGYDAFIAKFNSSGSRQWGTYYGGNGQDAGYGIAIDAANNIFIVGYTTSTSVIATSGAYQTSLGGGDYDAFIVKFNSSGSRQWATYYGGSELDLGKGIAADASGNVLITGYTGSTSIASSGAYQTTFGGATDAFIVKFNSFGTLQWATYYGGTDTESGSAIATDTSGNVYCTGYTLSTSSIASSGAYQTILSGMSGDAFIVKFSSSGSRLWATYYGGTGGETGYGIAIHPNGNIFITGNTDSQSGLGTSGAYQTNNGGGIDVFIAKFNSSGSRLWATYYGGTGDDYGAGIATDASGNIFITGKTYSSSSIATSGAYQTMYGGARDAFVAAFTSSGNLPVQLISFDAKLENNKEVVCNWATASEVNNDYFEVESSLDNSQWLTAGKVDGNGTTNSMRNYQFTDRVPTPPDRTRTIYYRLRQTDFDGKNTLSETRVVKLKEENTDWTIYPNPATNEIFIYLNLSLSESNTVIEVFDLNGSKVMVFDQDLSANNNKIDLSSLAPGMYFVMINNKALKFVKSN